MESPWPLKLAILLASLSFGAVLAAVTYYVYAPLAARLSALNLLAPITPISSDNYLTCQLELRGRMIITIIRGFIELSKKDIGMLYPK